MKNIAVFFSLLMLMQSCYTGQITLDEAVATQQKVRVIHQVKDSETYHRFHHVEYDNGVYKGIKKKTPSDEDMILQPRYVEKVVPRNKALSTVAVVVPVILVVAIILVFAFGGGGVGFDGEVLPNIQ